MDEKFVTREEHSEFLKRIDTEHRRLEDEDRRQNQRLNRLEETMQNVAAINTSVEKLALNMENMLKEQITQGKRIADLERRDGDMWRNSVKYVITAILGVLVGFLFKQLGV